MDLWTTAGHERIFDHDDVIPHVIDSSDLRPEPPWSCAPSCSATRTDPSAETMAP